MQGSNVHNIYVVEQKSRMEAINKIIKFDCKRM